MFILTKVFQFMFYYLTRFFFHFLLFNKHISYEYKNHKINVTQLYIDDNHLIFPLNLSDSEFKLTKC